MLMCAHLGAIAVPKICYGRRIWLINRIITICASAKDYTRSGRTIFASHRRVLHSFTIACLFLLGQSCGLSLGQKHFFGISGG